MFGGGRDPETLIETICEVCMPASTARRRGQSAWLIELLLLSPVMGLIALGVLEVRRAYAVEATLRSAAIAAVEEGRDDQQADAVLRHQLQTALHVDAADVDISTVTDSKSSRSLRVSVPYRLVGGSLAAFFPSALVTVTSR
jgi:hypothetical protein